MNLKYSPDAGISSVLASLAIPVGRKDLAVQMEELSGGLPLSRAFLVLTELSREPIS